MHMRLKLGLFLAALTMSISSADAPLRQRGGAVPESPMGSRDLGLARAAYSCVDPDVSRQLCVPVSYRIASAQLPPRAS